MSSKLGVQTKYLWSKLTRVCLPRKFWTVWYNRSE